MITTSHRVIIAACVLVVLLFLALQHSLQVETPQPLLPEEQEEFYDTVSADNKSEPFSVGFEPEFVEQDAGDDWRFHPARDVRNYGLNDAQCDIAFPGLWHEIDQAASYMRKHGPIIQGELNLDWRDRGVVRAMIYDHQLYIIEAKGCTYRRDFRERSLATLQAINRAITAYTGPIPNIEFTFCVEDIVYEKVEKTKRPPIWGFTRKPDWNNVWIMPDFGYWSWPTSPIGEYSDVRFQMGLRERGVPFPEKKEKVLWRGAPMTEQREKLVAQWEHKPWSDIVPFDWSDPDREKKFVDMPDHCQWKYVLHTEGRSYSGRLKYLQNCHSVPIIPELKWIEPHHALLIPNGPRQNYIPVKYDFSDLEEKVQTLLASPEFAEQVADNNVEMFRDRYLTPAAQACYWRKLFKAWREVSFEPEFSDGYGHPRGMPFETYVLLDIYDSNPWKDPPGRKDKEDDD
ncbi:DUF821 domain-containing protein [Phyllosticta citriasiana]|uniref:DUF821 domain-containing protein n=1 Tax=Phyllosticta citriasiana TaxID=595635 RepID=A0ABR1KYM9_9PEZI